MKSIHPIWETSPECEPCSDMDILIRADSTLDGIHVFFAVGIAFPAMWLVSEKGGMSRQSARSLLNYNHGEDDFVVMEKQKKRKGNKTRHPLKHCFHTKETYRTMNTFTINRELLNTEVNKPVNSFRLRICITECPNICPSNKHTLLCWMLEDKRVYHQRCLWVI